MSTPEPSRRLVRASTVSTQAESAVRDMILEGQLAAGERLNEVTLSAELGISRGPLREALQRLAGAGLVTVISHRGAYVRTFDRDEIIELYELRTALEVHATRLLSRRGADADVSELRELLDTTRERIAVPESRAYPADLDFHMRLVALAGNSAITLAWTEAQQKITLARARSAQQPLRARAALHEHTELLDAVAEGAEDRAAALMVEHLEHSMWSALTALGANASSDLSQTGVHDE